MSRSIKLKATHRIFLLVILNQEGNIAGNFTIEALSEILKMVDILKLNDEERTTVALQDEMKPKMDTNGEPVLDAEGKPEMVRTGGLMWNPAAAESLEGEYTLTDTQVEVLRDILRKKDEKKEFTFTWFPVVKFLMDELKA
jgi:hypothetical protein